jgi:hypothetical protein
MERNGEDVDLASSPFPTLLESIQSVQIGLKIGIMR